MSQKSISIVITLVALVIYMGIVSMSQNASALTLRYKVKDMIILWLLPRIDKLT